MIGVGKSIWKVGPLLSGGPAAPAGEEIISAQVTYGALGTCQNGTLRTAKPLRLPNRMSLWTLKMAGQGNLFAGIVDQPTGNPGELGQVTLMAPHRQYLEALGANIGYPYPLRSFGVALNTGVQDWEKTSDVLGRVLDSYPTADYGVGPDLEGGIGLPDYGASIILDASQALSMSNQGYSIPNYTTDALFDPGEGWPKYTYRRDVPGYAPRITGQATADPAIITQQEKVAFFRLDWPVNNTVTDGVTHVYNNVIVADGKINKYAESDSTATQIMSDVGSFLWRSPKELPDRRNKKVTIRCPYLVTAIEPWPPPAPVRMGQMMGGYTTVYVNDTTAYKIDAPNLPADVTVEQASSAYYALRYEANSTLAAANASVNSATSTAVDAANAAGAQVNAVQVQVNKLSTAVNTLQAALLTPRGTPKNGEVKLTLSLYGTEGKTLLATQMHILKEVDLGLVLAFEFVVDNIGADELLCLRYDLVTQDTGKAVTIAFNPIEATLDYETPNLSAVKMPEGWDAPVSVGPVYVLKFAGWHIPPIRVTGLPGGVTQMAAGSTVTHNRQEASTTVTTMAWPYAGQRRA